MRGANRDARHLAQLATEMRGDPVSGAETLAIAAVVAILGHARHSEVAVLLSDVLSPILDTAGLTITRRSA